MTLIILELIQVVIIYLTLNTNFWRKDISNNTYFVSGKVGIGLTNPASNCILDVSGNINCNEIYRNGTPISSTLSLFLTLNGGTFTGISTGTTISATNLTATNLTGSGSAITNLNASNITSGILSVLNGDIGTSLRLHPLPAHHPRVRMLLLRKQIASLRIYIVQTFPGCKLSHHSQCLLVLMALSIISEIVIVGNEDNPS